MEPVRSARNQRVAAAVRLRRAGERRQARQTLLEGPHLLRMAAAVAARVGPVFALADDTVTAHLVAEAGYELVEVTQPVLDRLAPTQHPRGPVAVLSIPDSVPIKDRHAVVLWGVGDPGNAGTLIRTAAAFGFGVIFGPGAVDPWNPKVLRSAAGAHFATPIELGLSGLDALRTRGFLTVATVVGGAVGPSQLPRTDRLAIVIGDEARGLPGALVAACDLKVTIPMQVGVESLNAAVAGAVLMHEVYVGYGGGSSTHD
jgi:TrmH family RNA methyltransferase